MYLETITVDNYRSISTLSVDPCRDFNVFIGRNNSGKSNILTSIDAFFSAAVSDIINPKPTLGSEIDFFQKDFSRTIKIETTFRMSSGERDKLLSEISEERPQVRNLIEDIGSEVRVSFIVAITPPPKRFSYVQEVSIIQGSERRQLFEIGMGAAQELYENSRAMDRAENSRATLNRFLQYFDSEDYANARREPAITSLEYYFRRSTENVDPAVVSQARKAFNSTDSYDAFVAAINQLAKAADAEKTTIASKPISSSIRTFSGQENTVPNYVKSLVQRVAATKILHFKERRVPIGSEEAKRLLSLKIRRGGPDILVRIQSTINELLGVKVDAFEGPSTRRGEASAELDVDDFLIQANGSGIREALRLILDTEFEKPQILLVEEPEIHLHPALETSIMSYLREISQRGIQVFITTHSTNFLDTGNFQNVFLVSKEDSTKVVPLTLAEAEEKLPSELGIRLSSLFMYDQIVFVEGPSDEQIIRELARALDINLGRLNVGFIQMRGVRNIGHYAAADVVSFLTKRRVKLWFVVDSDESESVHFKRLKDDFGKNAHIHVLERREIENYLLSPSANIVHLTNRGKNSHESSFSAPTNSEFSEQIASCADKLKPLAVWKRVVASTRRPFFPIDGDKSPPRDVKEMKDRSKSAFEQLRSSVASASKEIDGICERAASEIESKWANEKLKIVPGSALLDEVYQLYGFRFDKMRDGVALASLLHASDVDSELKEFLGRLAAE